MRPSLLAFALVVASATLPAGLAADLPAEQVEFFEKKVRPVLTEKCYKCHSVESGKSKGGLTLDSREAILKGGEGGAAVVPGDVDKSLLITAITYADKDLKMPPKKDGTGRLSEEEIANLTEWVKMGAPDPRTAAATPPKRTGLSEEARRHWAYQPVKRPHVPVVKNRAWGITPVDAFILQKIEERGMAPSPVANKETLLRRATYDLTGLPPTPRELESFMSDATSDCFAKVVDRLLASPHYGERWGRYWLDTARYADTTGNKNKNREYRYAFAWTYRDYVVRSFNEDKPYDHFILEQLAADQMPDLKDKRDLAALGFLTVGDRTGNANDVINDRIDTVTKGFLAMTVTCARCHDHKFDPIPTKDYYALHGVFNSITEPEEMPVIMQAPDKAKAADFAQKLAALEQEDRDTYFSIAQTKNAAFRQKASRYILASYYLAGKNAKAEDFAKSAELRKELDGDVVQRVQGIANREGAIFGPIRRFKEGTWGRPDPKPLNPIVATAFAGKTPKTIEEVADTYGRIFANLQTRGEAYIKACKDAKVADAKVTGFSPAETDLVNFPFATLPAGALTTEVLRKAVQGWPDNGRFAFNKINNLEMTHEGTTPRAMVVSDLPTPRNSPVFIRGQANVPGNVEPRHFLEVLSGGNPQPFTGGSGRLELAQEIASKQNPLTARVIVNRVWMHHFGEGFVRTLDDLGTQSEPPSHPELLDFLSSYLMDRDWSLKALHKLIMLSKVYQESSHTVPEYETMDPDNRLLWRANIRRMDFESMRDSLLVMSGKLDHTVGGPPVNLTDEPYSYRRSIYGYIDRGNLPELIQTFDFSNPTMPNSKRTTTVVPQQALFLMNSPMVVDVARAIVARPDVAKSYRSEHKIYFIYRTILQRAPKQEELKTALAFYEKELREQENVVEAAQAMTEKSVRKAQERAKRMGSMADTGTSAIQNRGEMVERKPLLPWETLAHALLLSNEAAYTN